MSQIIAETIAKFDENRCVIEDEFGIVFPDETWRNITRLIDQYLRGRLTWSIAAIDADERRAILNIAETSIQLARTISALPTDLNQRLLWAFQKDDLAGRNALSPLNHQAEPVRDVLQLALACLNLIASAPLRKKGQKRSTEETNLFLGLLKLHFRSAISQVPGAKKPHFNTFALRIFDLFPLRYPYRPQSVEAALKAFRRSGLGQE